MSPDQEGRGCQRCCPMSCCFRAPLGTGSKKIQLLPLPPTLVLVPCTCHSLLQHLPMLLVGGFVVSLVMSPPFPSSTSFIPPST